MKRLARREFLKSATLLGTLSSAGDGVLWLMGQARLGTQGLASAAQPDAGASIAPPVNTDANLIAAPDDPAQWPAYRDVLVRWREETKQRLHYDDALYRRPEFAWVPSAFSCCFVMLCDETFYDPRQGRFAAEAFLDHGQREFGGYDSVVLWHAYP